MATYSSVGLKKLKFTARDRVKLLDGDQYIVVDMADKYVARITLNRPEKRNCMNHELRAQLFEALFLLDQDPDVRVTIICGAGKCFCAGYDLDMRRNVAMPFFEAEGDGQFQRHVLNSWFKIMDLAKPVIAQVHGHCLAGGSELAAACDLVYVSPDAKIGYPPVRSMGLPDMQIYPWLCGPRRAMELMLTGDTMNGEQAVEYGWANQCFPREALNEKVLERARKIALIPSDLLAFNKRSVHRASEAMGMRTHLRTGSDLQALSFHTPSSRMFMKGFTGRGSSAKKMFTKRDKKFRDGRTAKPKSKL